MNKLNIILYFYLRKQLVGRTVREKNVPVFGKFVVSRLQFRQFCFDLKEKVDILKPGFWATK